MNSIHEILDLSTEKLESMTDEEVIKLLGPLIPKSREPSPESQADKVADLLAKCAHLYKQ